MKNVADTSESNVKAKMKKKNIDILDTNHQMLIDHQITASNMQGSHQYADGVKSEPRGRNNEQRVHKQNSKKSTNYG